MMRIFLSVLALLIGAAAATVLAGNARWHRSTAEHVALLAPKKSGAMYDRSADTLPPPARRYFQRTLRDGQRLVTSAVASQEGEFFLNGAWRRMTATQEFAADPPGFVWDARIAMAAPFWARVRDSYVHGSARMTASLWMIHTLVDLRDAPELNAGALQRWLGEAVWFPTALLPSERIAWTARDDRSATVTLRESGTEVALLFEIDPSGRVTAISGDRFKEDGGKFTRQPWQIQCTDHQERGGMVVPLQCEAAWIVNGAAEPYWRGRIASIEYRFD